MTEGRQGNTGYLSGPNIRHPLEGRIHERQGPLLAEIREGVRTKRENRVELTHQTDNLLRGLDAMRDVDQRAHHPQGHTIAGSLDHAAMAGHPDQTAIDMAHLMFEIEIVATASQVQLELILNPQQPVTRQLVVEGRNMTLGRHFEGIETKA